jgi:hypothetical protein
MLETQRLLFQRVMDVWCGILSQTSIELPPLESPEMLDVELPLAHPIKTDKLLRESYTVVAREISVCTEIRML